MQNTDPRTGRNNRCATGWSAAGVPRATGFHERLLPMTFA